MTTNPLALVDLLAGIHPALPAAVGHAMTYCVEDDSALEQRVLCDRELDAAAKEFYALARTLACQHTNTYTEVTLYEVFDACDNLVAGPFADDHVAATDALVAAGDGAWIGERPQDDD